MRDAFLMLRLAAISRLPWNKEYHRRRRFLLHRIRELHKLIENGNAREVKMYEEDLVLNRKLLEQLELFLLGESRCEPFAASST